MTGSLTTSFSGASATVDALGSQLVAYRLARARVDELRVDTGDAA
jgi:hypothetical protein